MKRRLLAAALTAALALAPSPAHADHYWLSQTGQPMHFQRGGGGMAGALTIGGYRYIGIHNGIDQTGWFPGAIAEAAERWNDRNWHAAYLTPSNLDPRQFPWACGPTPPPDGWGISLCTGTPAPGALAETQAHLVSGHLIWAKITIRPGLSVEQTSTVLTHELGHALGLSHRPPGTASVMAPDGGWNGGWPDAHDMDTVAVMYDHAH